LGGVKIGSNITVSSDGTISVGASNITAALGYTPGKTIISTDLYEVSSITFSSAIQANPNIKYSLSFAPSFVLLCANFKCTYSGGNMSVIYGEPSGNGYIIRQNIEIGTYAVIAFKSF
jgi:hypothetical protein